MKFDLPPDVRQKLIEKGEFSFKLLFVTVTLDSTDMSVDAIVLLFIAAAAVNFLLWPLVFLGVLKLLGFPMTAPHAYLGMLLMLFLVGAYFRKA